VTAISLGSVVLCPPGNVHVVPGGGCWATGAYHVGPGRDFDEDGTRIEEVGNSRVSIRGEESCGNRAHHAVACLAPGGHGE